jgi:hypothetical protein
MTYTTSKAQSTIGLVLSIGPAASTGTPPTGVTGSTTSASTSVTAVTNTVGLAIGDSVSGTGIPSGATVASFTTNTITLSIAATATGSAVALTFAIAYTPIFELSGVPISGQQWSVEDTTNFQSLSVKEKLKTILDTGKMTLTGNRVSTDTGQAALKAAFLDPSNAYLFQLTYPKETGQVTTGDSETFGALVVSYDVALEVGKVVKITVGLDRTGTPTFTEGA